MLLNGLAMAIAVAVSTPSGPFAMQPRVLTITRTQPIAELEFSSLYAETQIFDVRIVRWSQRDGHDIVTPDAGFVIAPAVFSIEPYETVLVRMQPRAFAASPVEQSFKIIATSVVPGAQAPPPDARRLEALLFVPAAAPTIDPSFTLKTTAPGQADLTVANHGNTHVYLGNVLIENTQKIYGGTIDDYVLANSTKTFHLRVSGALSRGNASLTYHDAQGGRQTASVTVVP